jgi:hypothetical protein
MSGAVWACAEDATAQRSATKAEQRKTFTAQPPVTLNFWTRRPVDASPT